MHQKNKIESQMANILLGMVIYSHSSSEDMLVHHRDVATPRDPITTRMGEHFYRYFPRVLNSSFLLALGAEAAILARKDLPTTDRGTLSGDMQRFKAASFYSLLFWADGLGLDRSYFRQAPRSGSSNWSILSTLRPDSQTLGQG